MFTNWLERLKRLEEELKEAKEAVIAHPFTCSCSGCSRLAVVGAAVYQARNRVICAQP